MTELDKKNVITSHLLSTKRNKYVNTAWDDVADQKSLKELSISYVQRGLENWIYRLQWLEDNDRNRGICRSHSKHPRDNFNQIIKNDIKKVKRTRSTELQGPSMNIYNSLWRALSTIFKIKMLSLKSAIGMDKILLLWTLFKTYQGIEDQVVRHTK